LRDNGVLGSRRINESDIAPFGLVPRADTNNPLAVLFAIDSNYRNPYTQQISFGVERQLVKDLSLSADYIFVRGAKITRARDSNLLSAPINPATGIRDWRGSNPGWAGANIFNCFRKPQTLQFNVYESSANSFYHGFTLSANKRFSHHFLFLASYT